MNRIKLTILSAVLTAATILGGLAGHAYAAGNASLSLAGGAHRVGSSFSVPIYVNSADPVNVVQADFSYDTSALQFQGVSCGGAFGITADSRANSVSCGVSGGGAVTGSQLVGIINFKALAGSGSSMVSIAPSSHVYSSTDNSDIWNGVANSAGISFSTPVAVAPVAAPVAPAPAPVVKAEQKAVPVVKAGPSVTKSTSGWPVVLSIIGAALLALIALAVIFRKQIMDRTKKQRKNLSKTFTKSKKSFAVKVKAIPSITK